jgi:hypothetical protein
MKFETEEEEIRAELLGFALGALDFVRPFIPWITD